MACWVPLPGPPFICPFLSPKLFLNQVASLSQVALGNLSLFSVLFKHFGFLLRLTGVHSLGVITARGTVIIPPPWDPIKKKNSSFVQGLRFEPSSGVHGSKPQSAFKKIKQTYLRYIIRLCSIALKTTFHPFTTSSILLRHPLSQNI